MEISRLRSRKHESEIVNQIWAKNKYYGFRKGKQHLLELLYAFPDSQLRAQQNTFF